MADCSSKFASIRHIGLGDTVYLQSLVDLSIIKVVLSLRKSEDPKITHFPTYSESGDPLRDLNEKIYKKLSRLNLPEHLKGRMFYFIDETSTYVLEWYLFGHSFKHFGSSKSVVPDFVWTSQGTVHEDKTALIITQREDLDLMERYRIAFVFNLEDQLPVLREKLKKDVKYRNVHVEPSIMVVGPIIPNFSQLKSEFLQSFGSLLFRRNPFALEKLSADSKNREHFLSQFLEKPIFWSCRSKFTALHLISKMNETEKNFVIQNYARDILKCYSDGLPYPRWKYLFFETTTFLMPFLTKSDISYLIDLICVQIKYSEKYPIDFKIILTDFLNLLTKFGKTDFGEIICRDLRFLIEAGDAKHIIMILKESNLEARKSFFAYLSGHVFRFQDLGFFEFLIQNCGMTKIELEDLLKFIARKDFDEGVNFISTRLGFSDDLNCNPYNKITSDDKMKVIELLKNMILSENKNY